MTNVLYLDDFTLLEDDVLMHVDGGSKFGDACKTVGGGMMAVGAISGGISVGIPATAPVAAPLGAALGIIGGLTYLVGAIANR